MPDNQSIEDLKAAVAEQTSVIDSTTTLLQSLTERLNAIANASANNGDNTDELEQLVTELRAHTTSLASAVQANTPADPLAKAVPSPTPLDTGTSTPTPDTGMATPDSTTQEQTVIGDGGQPVSSPGVDASESGGSSGSDASQQNGPTE